MDVAKNGAQSWPTSTRPGEPTNEEGRMRTKLVSVLLLGAFTAACRTSGESPRDAALLQLSVNRQKWSTAAVHNYSFDYDFTANAFSPPLHITVQSHPVTRVTDSSAGAAYSYPGAPT